MRNAQLENGDRAMTRNLGNRYRYPAQRALIGESGQYKGNIEWVVQGSYSNSNGVVWQRAFARWIQSIGNVDEIRFDGDGAGVFSSGVINHIRTGKRPRTVCSEFSHKLRQILLSGGHCNEILDDALIQPTDGGTSVVIANQFLDALPFTVMRRLYPSGKLQELAISGSGNPYYETIDMATIEVSACGGTDQRTGAFPYSPAKRNYVRSILSRAGTTYLAVLDWTPARSHDDYVNDLATGSLVHSSTPSRQLAMIAKEVGASVLFSDIALTWGHMDVGVKEIPIDLYSNLGLTIIKSENTIKTKNLYCSIDGGQ